jgi:hypothetical protein
MDAHPHFVHIDESTSEVGNIHDVSGKGDGR